MSGQSPNPRTVTERLAARLERPAAAADRQRAALHVLDWTGCAVAGTAAPAAAAMATALGEDAKHDVLYLGALGNILEMDDVDKRALLHPGPVVIPATIAAAREANATADAFLDAVVRGYEAVIRIGRAVGPDHYRYWHNTGTCGPFGAAAAAASLFGLDTEKTVWALGLAGTQASGFWQTRHEPQSHAKQLHTARAAHAGLFAAKLTRAGFVGLKTLLEGPQGFFAATCGGDDPDAVVDVDVDAPWCIHEVSFKPWPACRHVHAAIDAALALRADNSRWRDAGAFTVRTYKDALTFCDKPAPADTLSAKFSLQHSVAVALLRGEPKLSDFEGEALAAPDIAALRDKISVIEDEDFTRVYPARFGARLDAHNADREDMIATIPDALGDPENPASDDVIKEKAVRLMAAGGMSDNGSSALRMAATSLADGGALDEYFNLLFGEGLS